MSRRQGAAPAGIGADRLEGFATGLLGDDDLSVRDCHVLVVGVAWFGEEPVAEAADLFVGLRGELYQLEAAGSWAFADELDLFSCSETVGDLADLFVDRSAGDLALQRFEASQTRSAAPAALRILVLLRRRSWPRVCDALRSAPSPGQRDELACDHQRVVALWFGFTGLGKFGMLGKRGKSGNWKPGIFGNGIVGIGIAAPVPAKSLVAPVSVILIVPAG